MPLAKSGSQKAFVKNLKTEMEHGKPQKQSLAIAYNMKRKYGKAYGGHYDDGGAVRDESRYQPYQEPKTAPGPGPVSAADASNIASAFKAKGGKIHPVYKAVGHSEGGFLNDEKASGYDSELGQYHLTPDEAALVESHRALNQHGRFEVGPLDEMHAYGGEAGIHDDERDPIHPKHLGPEHSDYIGSHQSPKHQDIVARIMARRQYSQGGKVANEDKRLAGQRPDEFDDLVLRDDLSSSYGKDDNSGDELGNEGEDKRRRDIISRVMEMKRKKDRLPSPA